MTCSKDMHRWKVTEQGRNCSDLCTPVCSRCFRFIKLWLISVEINLCTNRIMLHIILGRIWNSYQHLFLGDLSFSLLKTHLLVFMIQYKNIIKKNDLWSHPLLFWSPWTLFFGLTCQHNPWKKFFSLISDEVGLGFISWQLCFYFPSPVCVCADTTDVTRQSKNIVLAFLIKEPILLPE